MYIGKIYTKLYSNRDWTGLVQLINEIRQFTRGTDDNKAKNPKIAPYIDNFRHEAAKNAVEMRKKLIEEGKYDPDYNFRVIQNARDIASGSTRHAMYKSDDKDVWSLGTSGSKREALDTLEKGDSLRDQVTKWNNRKSRELNAEVDSLNNDYDNQRTQIINDNPIPDSFWDNISGKTRRYIEDRDKKLDSAESDYKRRKGKLQNKIDHHNKFGDTKTRLIGYYDN